MNLDPYLSLLFKATGPGGVIPSERGGPPLTFGQKYFVVAVTSLLITRFFFPTPEMKARGRAVRMRYWNPKSVS